MLRPGITLSLNQCLEKGLNLIEKLPAILAGFCMNRLGIVADIRGAFLQLSIAPGDRDYLRCLWETTDGRVIIYRHCRDVFGVSPSPFQLAASIEYHLGQVLAECKSGVRDLSVNLVERLKGSFYVDNCDTSLDTQTDCLEFIKLAKSIMWERTFDLRGWEFNTNDKVSPSSVLGLLWDRKTDTLEINVVNLSSIKLETVTKRITLSAAHRIFDPCRMVCDVSLIPKLLLQRTWKQDTTWDQEVDPELSARFVTWMEEIRLLSKVKMSRWLLGCTESKVNWTLHIFSDACLASYSSAAFLKVASRKGVRLQLVSAKSRVAPIKNAF
ncbi:hypothetical protein ILUMI_17490 [Ignelater luminosus]|uniref:Reverse transcriptase domain-containing protein n=1 Tax=Ignelater luminosus TaxID=2038154 RepID=A0A8K0CQX7_IGNLU|nr:hypothetical protein ILUMI_17490 [Ignelater luminosus]